MPSYTRAPVFTERAAGPLPQYARVTKDGNGRLVLAGDEQHCGVTVVPAYVPNEPLAIRAAGKGATGKYIAAAAFAKGALVTSHDPSPAAADGKVSTGGTIAIGVAREAAAADGDIIEVIHT